MITWNTYYGTPTYFSVMADVLGSGALVANSATTTGFTVQHGNNTIFFDGAFTIGEFGILTGGTISGFHVYSGAKHLLDASGYAIDLDDFLAGSAATQLGQNLLVEVSKTINGSPEDDIIAGGGVNDRIFGSGGADTIFGGLSDDFVSGGAGMDTLIGGDATAGLFDGIDTVDYSQKTGSLVITLTEDVVTTVTVNGVAEDTIIEFENANGGSGNDHITGSVRANRLVGNGGNDILDGGLGADTLIGGLGNDIYLVDRLDDIVAEAPGQGNDTVQASFSHTLPSGVENLILFGASAKDGTGNNLGNIIAGNDEDNLLNGGFGADELIGRVGDDTYVIDNLGDVVTELASEGTDTVSASVSFALGVNVENLVLTGAEAIDGTGNGLANAINGNAAANVLGGGLGLDILTGGEGSDTFVFTSKLGKANVDTITDFAAGFDHVGLDADIFKKVNDAGTLKAKFFANGKADDANDFIVFKEKSGKVLYDKDGDGGAKAKLVATLDGTPELDRGDFFIL